MTNSRNWASVLDREFQSECVFLSLMSANTMRMLNKRVKSVGMSVTSRAQNSLSLTHTHTHTHALQSQHDMCD